MIVIGHRISRQVHDAKQHQLKALDAIEQIPPRYSRQFALALFPLKPHVY